MSTKNDRRSAKRTVATVPVRLKSSRGHSEVAAETRDISTNGVFLYTDSRIAEGANLEMVLILPPELTAGEKCWVCCQAKVLRVETTAGQKFGLAASIQRMNFLPEIPT
jgi:hypothetical protein